MSKQHPAISAYRSLRKQESNTTLLHFALLQQAWLETRGVPEQRPSEYSMVLLRAMTYAFLLSQGFSEHEVRDQLIETMESCLGQTATKNLLPMQPGDVPETCANVDDLQRDVGFRPATAIEEGIERFVDWYQEYYRSG